MDTIVALIMMLFTQLFGMGQDVAQQTESTDVSATETAQVVSVIDGDTIKVLLNGVEETVRYIGIDTPEPYRDGEPACYSAEASSRNRELVVGKEVQLVADAENTDRYDRLLRYVYVDDVFVNELLLHEGYATILTITPNTQFAAEFTTIEGEAQSAGRGLWSACTSAETPAQTAAAETVIDTTTLPEGQQKLLDFFGIDSTTFTLTAEMVACANTAIGIDRMAEIITGDVPSLAEGMKLFGCYNS